MRESFAIFWAMFVGKVRYIHGFDARPDPDKPTRIHITFGRDSFRSYASYRRITARYDLLPSLRSLSTNMFLVDQIDALATNPAQISSSNSHRSVLDIAQLDFQRGQYDQCIVVLSEALAHESTDILNRKHTVDMMDTAIMRLRCLEMRSAAFIETGQTKRAIQDCSTGLELWLSSMDVTLYCVLPSYACFLVIAYLN